jgi:6-phosphogluconate dehydrogenase (decarboxylating)
MTSDATKNPLLTLSLKRVYDNPWIVVREDRVVHPDGEPTEQTIAHLAELLERGDTVIDGGNSNYKDTVRRAGRSWAQRRRRRDQRRYLGA